MSHTAAYKLKSVKYVMETGNRAESKRRFMHYLRRRLQKIAGKNIKYDYNTL